MPHQHGNLGQINGFQLLKFLGKGTFGAVYQARREADGKIYAIKKVDTRKMSTKERAEAVNEIRVLASLAGDHLITFYEAFVEQDVLYIVTEFASQGDLLQLLKNKRRAGHLPESLVWSYFLQMCLGIKTMHDNNILHRDLKAANVFMCSNTRLKLGDLGVAKVLKHEQALASTQVGTPYYVAPEVWRNKPYNAKCDMWSLGCLLYELCTFRPPFEAESMEGLARKVMKGRYDQIPANYSQALRTTLSKLLVVEPNFRSSVNDILNTQIVQEKMRDLEKAIAANDHPPAEGIDIVKTIQVPRRFNDLTKNLPPSRYDQPMGLSPPMEDASAKPMAGPPVPARPDVPHKVRPPPMPRNAAEGPHGHHDAAGDQPTEVARLQRHAGEGNTVAKAAASAANAGGGGGFNKEGARLPMMPGAQQQQQAQQKYHQQKQQPPQPYPPAAGQRHRADPTNDSHSILGNHFNHPGVHPYAQQQQQHNNHKQGGGGGFLPAVPGAKPPPTPASVYSQQQGAAGGRGALPRYADLTPSREIRMVYHKPNGESRVSIFQRGQTRGHAYYNPITHQAMDSASLAAGSHYHNRNQPASQSRAYNANIANQYTAQRRRVTPSHWY